MATRRKKIPLSATLLRVAWLSVLLGLGMELLLLAIAAWFSQPGPIHTLAADLVQKVSWATLVCSGVALGTGAAKMRTRTMGLAGFVAAPVAFYIAKIAHKSVTQALAIAGPVVAGPTPLTLAAIKACEYAVLGYGIGRINAGKESDLRQHLLTGLGIGLVFGGLTVYLMVTMANPTLPTFGIVARCANEIIFPIGCAMVLYIAQKLGEAHSDGIEVDAPTEALDDAA